MGNGEIIRLFDRYTKEFLAKLEIKGDELFAVPVEEYKSKHEKNFEIILCQSLPKLNKMDFIVQKSTEVGVSAIIPVLSEKTVTKSANLKSKILRWKKIAEESARQCERIDVPVIEMPAKFDEIVARPHSTALKLILHTNSDNKLKDLLRAHSGVHSAVILIGPEGGFDEKEVELAKGRGFMPVRLWENILRTETAGMIAAGIIAYEWG